jgi:hypothetical protein
MRVIQRLFVSALALVALSAWAQACENKQRHSEQQIKEEANIMRDPERDGFARVLAFEQLMCDERSSVRSMALEAARTSEFAPLTMEYVSHSMFEKSVVVIELLRKEGLTQEVYDVINETVMIDIRIGFRGRQQNCLSLHQADGRCYSSTFSITGNIIEFSSSHWKGFFEFDGERTLVGLVKYYQLSHDIPARIRLN